LELFQFRTRKVTQKQHINGQNCVKQEYKIWCKNFQMLPNNHILDVGSFLAAPYRQDEKLNLT